MVLPNDDVIWRIINDNFCSFKTKTVTSNFCRNENNVTGLCNKSSCPLANSSYATVREIGGACYLYKKVPERAHLPSRLWEKIRLKGSNEQVLEKLDKELEYMPEFYQAKCKARFLRIQEYLRRAQRLANDPNQPILTAKKKKVERREASREARAKKVAQVEHAIERELLERLQKGVYGDIYNLPQATFEKVLSQHGKADEMEEELEYVEGEELEEEEGEEEEEEVEYEQDFEPSDAEQEQLVGDLEDLVGRPAPTKRKARVEIEYEEDEGPSRQLSR